jgi:hypothetical protein
MRRCGNDSTDSGWVQWRVRANVIGPGFTTWGILREPESLLASTENGS